MKCGWLAVAAAIACSVVVAAQRPSAAQSAPPGRGASPPPASADADVVLDADVHVKSIRYTIVPKNATVKVSGVNQVGGSTVTRTNVPQHPQAGVTYRNVRIQLHAASRFVDPHPSPTPAARS